MNPTSAAKPTWVRNTRKKADTPLPAFALGRSIAILNSTPAAQSLLALERCIGAPVAVTADH